MSEFRDFTTSPGDFPLPAGNWRIRFVAKNAAGASVPGAWSDTVTVNPPAQPRPVILSISPDQTGAPDTAVILSVTATGATSYVWQNNGFGVWAGDTSGSSITVSVPGEGGKSIGWRCVVSNAVGLTYSRTVTLTATADAANPFAGKVGHVRVGSEVYAAAANPRSGYPLWQDRLGRIAAQPSSMWASWNLNNDPEGWMRRHRNNIGDKSQITPVYYIPGRDNGSFSAGGASSIAAYQAYVDALIRGLDGRPTPICLEPDALPLCEGASGQARTDRINTLRWAMTRFANANCPVYIDAGHTGFPSNPQVMLDLLYEVNAEIGRGFTLNVSNFITNADLNARARFLIDGFTRKRLKYVLDTSRNGRGPWQNSGVSQPYLNPLYRATGEIPRAVTNVPDLDAYWWIKTPGGSDANNGRVEEDGSVAPSAGSYWSAAGYFQADKGVADGRLPTGPSAPTTTSAPAPAPAPAPTGPGIWVSTAEVQALPAPPSLVTNAANGQVFAQLGPSGTTNDGNNSTQDTNCYAAALLGARGNTAMADKAKGGIDSLRTVPADGRALEISRSLPMYIISANLLNYRASDARIKQLIFDTGIQGHSGGAGILGTARASASNWGAMSVAATTCYALHVGDTALAQEMASITKAWLGEARGPFSVMSSDWHSSTVDANKRGVNPRGATKDGHAFGGIQPEDMRRWNSYAAGGYPPQPTGYIWEGLSPRIWTVVMLTRAGLMSYNAGDEGIKRAVEFNYSINASITSSHAGDDQTLGYLLRKYFGLSTLVTGITDSVFKNMAFCGYTHG